MSAPAAGDPRILANRLIDAGVPVVVCRPNPNRGRPTPTDPTRTDQRELLVPSGWSTITAADCDVSSFRAGVDVLAMVGGHGVDVVDVDVKDGGTVENLPPFRSFGLTRTPSVGTHHYVRSTGIGKISPLRTSVGFVGDYIGGTPQGGGRLLAYLPGSNRPKYPGGTYELVEDLDLDALLESDADDDLIGALLAHGGSRDGQPGRPAAKHSEVQAFHADHSELPASPCRYGRAAVDALVRDADAAVPGDPTRGRHGWAVASAARAVELVRAECATAADLDRLEATLDRIKPEGGDDWAGIVGWALANADGAVGCGIHGPDANADHAEGAEDELDDGYKPDDLEDAHLSQRIAADWLTDRHCWAAGLGWMKWDGRRWKHISDAAITEVIRKAHRKHAADEVRRGADVARVKALAGLLHASKIRAVVSLARGIVEVESNQFDLHPDLLNVNNGVVNLATGDLQPHDPDLHLTKIAPVNYQPGARHDDWDTALTALPDDVATWMQQRFGQAATGHMASDDILPVLRGSGANGKSTIVKAIHAALGDHAVVIPDRVLLANPSDHPTELMTLRGARLALLEELPEGRHLNVKRLKDTVGTSPITARAIAKDNITWVATHTLILTTNYLPLVDEVDHGTWRRLALVEFPFTFSDNTAANSATDRSKVEGLRERMVEGGHGRREAVLAWVVAGARRWYDNKRVAAPKPAKVFADTEKWRASADRVYAYFTDRLIPDKGSYVTAGDLYADFVRWHEHHGNKQWSDQTFTARFENHSEIRAASIERGRVMVAQTPGLSRPSEGPFLPALPRRATTWHGVRFRASIDDEAETADGNGEPVTRQNAAVSGVSGVLHPPSGGIRVSNLPTTPDTPDTEPSTTPVSNPVAAPPAAGGKPIPAAPTGGRRPAEPTETCPGCRHWTAIRNLTEFGGICGTCARAGRTARGDGGDHDHPERHHEHDLHLVHQHHEHDQQCGDHDHVDRDQVSNDVSDDVSDQVGDAVSYEASATYVIEHGTQQLTLPLALITDQCAACPSSREGCEARQAFAKGERCCRKCSHGDPDNECPPSNANNASMGRFFSTDKPRTTRVVVGHPSPLCADPFSQGDD